jgi:hypothetical protein
MTEKGAQSRTCMWNKVGFWLLVRPKTNKYADRVDVSTSLNPNFLATERMPQRVCSRLKDSRA